MDDPATAGAGWVRWASVAALMLLASACSSAGSEAGTEVPIEPPFEDCVSGRQPEEESPVVLLEPQRVQSPGSVKFTWADDVTVVGPDLGVSCWTGDSWKLVWISRRVYGGGRPIWSSLRRTTARTTKAGTRRRERCSSQPRRRPAGIAPVGDRTASGVPISR